MLLPPLLTLLLLVGCCTQSRQSSSSPPHLNNLSFVMTGGGFQEYFNATTIKGRANVAKATFAGVGAIVLYFKAFGGKKVSQVGDLSASAVAHVAAAESAGDAIVPGVVLRAGRRRHLGGDLVQVVVLPPP
jgi:up-regulated protein 5